jgi:hypothetical protein
MEFFMDIMPFEANPKSYRLISTVAITKVTDAQICEVGHNAVTHVLQMRDVVGLDDWCYPSVCI